MRFVFALAFFGQSSHVRGSLSSIWPTRAVRGAVPSGIVPWSGATGSAAGKTSALAFVVPPVHLCMRLGIAWAGRSKGLSLCGAGNWSFVAKSCPYPVGGGVQFFFGQGGFCCATA